MPENLTIAGQQIDPGEIDAAYVAVRARADASGYGKFISDELCHAVAADVVIAVENYRKAPVI